MVKFENVRNQKWKINNNYEIARTSSSAIGMDEQECHFNIIARSDNENFKIVVDSSYQSWITKLSKCELFELKYVLVSTLNNNILQVSGILDKKGLTLRMRKRIISEEERQKRSERMKKRFGKKKEVENK